MGKIWYGVVSEGVISPPPFLETSPSHNGKSCIVLYTSQIKKSSKKRTYRMKDLILMMNLKIMKIFPWEPNQMCRLHEYENCEDG